MEGVISKETRGALRGEANRPTLALALDALPLLSSRGTTVTKTLCGLLPGEQAGRRPRAAAALHPPTSHTRR